MIELENILRVTELLPWEIWVKGFCLGFLIFGFLVIAIVFITMGINFGHIGHDIDHDTNVSIEKDVSVEKDISVDKDFSIDKDVSVEKDLQIEKDLSVSHDLPIESIEDTGSGINVESGTAAPLMLILAVFSITFGGLGLLLFWQEPEMNPYIRISVIIIAPLILSTIVSVVWQKLTKSMTYRLPLDKEFIGKEAVVMINVDAKGGLIRVEMENQAEPFKVPAKVAIKGQEFLKEELVYIIGYEKNYYLVDDSIELLKPKKKENERVNER